jgi:PAS domain S-box-containing protein
MRQSVEIPRRFSEIMPGFTAALNQKRFSEKVSFRVRGNRGPLPAPDNRKKKGKKMHQNGNSGFDGVCLRQVFDSLPVAVTVTDPDGRILYYNAYSARVVDRKPEYIGRNIRDCHRQQKSIATIDRIFKEMKEGSRDAFYYEAERDGKTLAVTVTPWKKEGKLVGFIHSFVIKR